MSAEVPYDKTKTKVFVAHLGWWITETDVEEEVNRYGTVKEIKFYCEEATGRSRGFCTVEFDFPESAFDCLVSMRRVGGEDCAVMYLNEAIVNRVMSEVERSESEVVEINPHLIDAAGKPRGGVGFYQLVYIRSSGTWEVNTPGGRLNYTNREAPSSSTASAVAGDAGASASASAVAGDASEWLQGIDTMEERRRSNQGLSISGSTSPSTHGRSPDQTQQGRGRRHR